MNFPSPPSSPPSQEDANEYGTISDAKQVPLVNLIFGDRVRNPGPGAYMHDRAFARDAPGHTVGLARSGFVDAALATTRTRTGPATYTPNPGPGTFLGQGPDRTWARSDFRVATVAAFATSGRGDFSQDSRKRSERILRKYVTSGQRYI